MMKRLFPIIWGLLSAFLFMALHGGTPPISGLVEMPNGVANVMSTITPAAGNGDYVGSPKVTTWATKSRLSPPGTASIDRFEVRDGDQALIDVGTDKNRSEMADVHTKWAVGTTIWVAYSMYVVRADQQNGSIIGQLHGTGITGPGSAATVPFYASVYHNNILYSVQGSTENPVVDVPAVTNIQVVPLVTNTWINFVHKIKFGPSGDGTLDSWVNGAHLVSYTGVIGFSMDNGTYWKYGWYGSTDGNPSAVAIVWYANMEVGTADLSDRILNPKPVPVGTLW